MSGGQSVEPLFVLSLPRSGSTLVQRVVAAHPEVETTSEPWLLLPQLYARRERGVTAQYQHVAAAQAIDDFTDALPGGASDYDRELAHFITRLYSLAAGDGARYFLDKTPRYHLIAAELLRLFPNARIVYLWRNPLAIVASLLEAFRSGRFEPELFRTDLRDGVVNLTRSWELHREQACSVRYEKLIGDGDGEWRAMFDYLGLDFDPTLLREFSTVELGERYRDPALARYSAVSSEPLNKWRSAFGSPTRRHWARRYLAWIGDGRLATMGYDRGALLAQIRDDGSGRPPGADLLALGVSHALAARRRRAIGTEARAGGWLRRARTLLRRPVSP